MSLKQEYFELVNLLNKGNKQKNLQTEVYFFISEDQTKFYIAIDEKQKLLICQKPDFYQKWFESNVTKFSFIEKELASYLNYKLNEQDITAQVRSFIFK